MFPALWWLLGAAVAAAVAVACWLRPWRRGLNKNQISAAQKEFHRRREWLEVSFLEMAAASGKPRGLAWADCDFADAALFVADEGAGALTALVGVTVRFEAIEGGGMEEVEAVGNLRDATAVFHYERGQWFTQGRVIFNLPPHEAAERLGLRPLRLSRSGDSQSVFS